MLVTLQAPFVDFRDFYNSKPHRVCRPSWPKPGYNEFIRKFGGIDDRCIQDSDIKTVKIANLFSTERSYINATQRIDRTPFYLNVLSHKLKAKIVFFRIICDGKSVVRFELGIFVSNSSKKSSKRTWHSKGNVTELVRALTTLKLYRLKRTQKEKVDFHGMVAALRREYYFSSNLHDTDKVSFTSYLIKPLDWTALCILPVYHQYHWLEEESILKQPSRPYDIAKIQEPRAAKRVKTQYAMQVLAVGNTMKRCNLNQQRQFRINYLRVRAELQALWAVITEAEKTGRLGRYSDVNYEELRRYLNRSIDRIKDTVQSMSECKQTNQFKEVFEVEHFLFPTQIQTLNEHGVSLLSTARLVNAVEQSKIILNNQNGKVFIDMGDQYINQGNAGVVGPVTTSGDIKVQQNNFGGFDRNVLLQEIATLRGHIESLETKSEEQSEAIESLLAAEEAAVQSDEQKFWAALKKAGSWTIDIASKIGVGVAAAAIKKSWGF